MSSKILHSQWQSKCRLHYLGHQNVLKLLKIISNSSNSSWIIKCLLTSWLSGKQQSCCHTKRLPSKVRFLTETQKFNTNKHITVWLKHLQMFLSHSYGLNLIQLAGLEGFKTTSQLSPCTGFKGLLNNAHVEEVTSQKINNHKKSIEHLK